MYRFVSSVLLLLGVIAAIAFSAMFFSSQDPAHLKVALGLWLGVAWYFGFRKRTAKESSNPGAHSVSAADDHGHDAIDVSVTVPVALGALLALFGPYLMFRLVGWHAHPGMNFLAAVFGCTAASLFLVVVVVFRSINRSKK